MFSLAAFHPLEILYFWIAAHLLLTGPSSVKLLTEWAKSSTVLHICNILGDAVVDRLRRKVRPVSPQRSSWRSFEVVIEHWVTYGVQEKLS